MARKKENLGTRLTRLREIAKLNRLELAALAGVSQGALQLIEKGVTRSPSAIVISKICQALKISSAELLGEEANAQR